MNLFERMGRIFVRALLVGSLLLTIAKSSAAQVTASMTGRVLDTSGAAIPDAMVTVLSEETGATRSVTSDNSGKYEILSLPVGRYEAKTEKAGFKVSVQKGITLVVGQQAVVDLNLELGQLQQEVTVTAEAPLVNTTTEATSGLIGEQEVKDLPLNGRSFDQLITLNAGASNTTVLRGLQVGSGGVGASQGQWFTVSGNRMSDNQFLWDGVEYTGPSITHAVPGGVSGQLLGVDAVREFNVESNTYGAQYGKRAGGQISIVTMSGTNQLHGTAFEFVRNSVFDAANYFDRPVNSADVPIRIPPFKRNQFGGSLGGPIQKNKTFLFGNYEGFRQRLGVSNTSIVPDANARAGKLPCGVITPLPSGCKGTTDKTLMAVPGLQPGMLPILNAYWPVANGPSLGDGTATAFYNPLQSIQEDFGTARFDHNFSEKDTVSVNYLIDSGESITPIVDPLFYQAFGIRSQVLSAQETHIFSTNVINTATFGFSRAGITFTSAPYVALPTSVYFALGQFPNPGRPSIGGGNITAGGGSNSSHLTAARTLFTYQDQLQIIKGRHQISIGGLVSPLGSNEKDAKNTSGSASFATLEAFLQGTTQSFTVTPLIAPKYWRQTGGAWYVQDVMQVRPNLTVSLGLRHEFNNGWNEAKGQASNLAIDANGVPLTSYVVGSSVYGENNARWLFGPRVGVAWSPFGNGKTSVRAGFGTYYSAVDVLGHQFLDANPPFSGQVSFTNTAFLPLIPLNSAIPAAPACGPGVPKPCTTYTAQGVQTNLKMPTVEEWSLSVERQITPNSTLRLGYVGTHGYHGMEDGDPDQIPSQVCTSAAGCTSGGNITTLTGGKVAAGHVSQGARYIPISATLPNPFLAVGVLLYDESNSSYNGLNVEYQRRLSAGLLFKAAYTWSKSLDTVSGLNQGTDGGTGNIYDIGQPQLSYGPSTFDQRQKFVFNAGYDLPFGSSRHWLNGWTGVGGKVVSGWRVNTIITAQSGFPFTVFQGGNQSGNGETGTNNTGTPPSYNPAFSGPILLKTVAHWFNANAYALPTVGTFGNVGRDTLVGPDLRNVDLSLFKDTAVTERINTQFRVEAFNLFNHSNFGAPNNVAFSGAAISASAGAITSAATSRQIQFALKLMF